MLDDDRSPSLASSCVAGPQRFDEGELVSLPLHRDARSLCAELMDDQRAVAEGRGVHPEVYALGVRQHFTGRARDPDVVEDELGGAQRFDVAHVHPSGERVVEEGRQGDRQGAAAFAYLQVVGGAREEGEGDDHRPQAPPAPLRAAGSRLFRLALFCPAQGADGISGCRAPSSG